MGRQDIQYLISVRRLKHLEMPGLAVVPGNSVTALGGHVEPIVPMALPPLDH